MDELTLFGEIVRVIDDFGVVGVVVLFVAFLVWQEKHRAKQSEADRNVLTNHLSEMIRTDNKSRENLAVGLTKLADSVNSFQTRCGQIQDSLQNEVDRMMKR